MRVVGSCVVVCALLAVPLPGYAEPLTCQRSILKESTKLARTRIKELRKCEDRKLKGALPAGTECRAEPATAGKIARAESKLTRRLDGSCGGPDRTCGTGDDEPLAGIGWGPTCPDFQHGGCTNAIGGCDGIAECLVCTGGAATAQAVSLLYDGVLPSPEPDLLACQRAVGREMQRLFDTRANALRKCWDARLKGGHVNACPVPGDGKAAAHIAKAASKARARICKTCGGTDRVCGGGDDLAPEAIGFPLTCPDVGACAGVVSTLDDLVECAECVPGLDGECLDALAVPALASYPAACALAPIVADLLLAIDGTAPLDLDLGWTGLAHDLSTPWIGRLLLTATDCTGDGMPTFGVCTLGGPVHDAGIAGFLSRRCVDRSWMACATDAHCTAAGAEGPCRFFLGPPQPIAVGGVTSCVLNELSVPLTGTLDVEAGAIDAALGLTMHVHLSAGPLGDPCPRCGVDATCDAGPRQGMPCAVHGTSALFGDDDVSLDCPPFPGAIRLDAAVPLSTTTQQATLTAASPLCTGAGFTGFRCFCNSCAAPGHPPCRTDADCPGGTPGSCGGLRCLPPVEPALSGMPCSTPGADPVCAGGLCGVPGEPTKPNSCLSGVCTDLGGGAGMCASTLDGFCGPAEPFRGCAGASDCPFPGDDCILTERSCYPDNGVVGASVAVAGAPDPPLDGTLEPTLSGVFCVGPSAFSPLNTVRGLPGLGRVTASVTATVY